ncbi:hypothetical protein chiPu_0011212 [Chiloscyllium punctatum]|uniref:Uncharacterized protein n=1 Tax=Chiloscyllium punctatum TaxID=137246 RepID=A0A401SQT8_CHIPU|nr:hypothetical protein [Chiloscyllium punctatum]
MARSLCRCLCSVRSERALQVTSSGLHPGRWVGKGRPPAARGFHGNVHTASMLPVLVPVNTQGYRQAQSNAASHAPAALDSTSGGLEGGKTQESSAPGDMATNAITSNELTTIVKKHMPE